MVPIYHFVRKDAPAAQQPAISVEIRQTPTEGICYLVTKSGLYKQVRNAFYDLRLKVPGIAHLEDLREEVQLHVPKLPLDLVRQAEAFFCAVYALHHSEAIVVLLANPAFGEWRIATPQQSVSNGSLHVDYKPDSVDVPKGFEPFGTIHSHAAVTAFHSGTDDKDETHTDGLHITIGNLDRPQRSYAARWMIGGVPYKADLADVIAYPELPDPDPAWLNRVAVQSERTDSRDVGNPWFDPFTGEEEILTDDLREAYDEYMLEMSERFLDRHTRERGTQPQGGNQECLPL